MKRHAALLHISSPTSLIHTLASLNANEEFDAWLPSTCGFRKLRDLQFCALILCTMYWKSPASSLGEFPDVDPNPQRVPASIVNSLPGYTTRVSQLQQFSPPRVCRMSVPCGGGKTAIIAWLCALRGGNILIGTDSAQNARHILFVILKETNLASYMNVKLVRGGDKESVDSAGLNKRDTELLRNHTITDYEAGFDFQTPLVPDDGIGNIIIIDSMLIRLNKDSTGANKRLRVALSLMNWNLVIFDEADRFFTQESRKPFTEGFTFSDRGYIQHPMKLKFNVPDAVMMSGTWREGDDSNQCFERNWLKGCGPMLLRIKSIDLAKLGLLATPHFHLVACKDVPESKFGFDIPQIQRNKIQNESFQHGLTFSMLNVIEKILQMHSLMKGKVMIFSTLKEETRALSAIFPSAFTVTGSTESGEKSRSIKLYTTESSDRMDTRNVWITTNIGGRGTDMPEVTAIILIGGEATDTKWQQIGRGLRSWAGSSRCEVWDLAPEKVGWAKEWINNPDMEKFKKNHFNKINRLKNVLIEGFEDYISILDSQTCISKIDEEIERIRNKFSVSDQIPACSTNDIHVAANHAMCTLLDDFKVPSACPDISKVASKPVSKPKKQSAKSLIIQRNKNKGMHSVAPSTKKQKTATGSIPSSSSQCKLSSCREAAHKILNACYPISDDASLEELSTHRETLRATAESIILEAGNKLSEFVQDVVFENKGNHADCEFMNDSFPKPFKIHS